MAVGDVRSLAGVGGRADFPTPTHSIRTLPMQQRLRQASSRLVGWSDRDSGQQTSAPTNVAAPLESLRRFEVEEPVLRDAPRFIELERRGPLPIAPVFLNAQRRARPSKWSTAVRVRSTAMTKALRELDRGDR